MVIKDILTSASALVDRLDAEVILGHILSYKRAELLLHLFDEISKSDKIIFEKLIKQRQTGYPVAYITGTKEFYSLDFFVEEGILIPRPDTETLVDVASSLSENKKILDICCGSGCIGISTYIYGKAYSLDMCDISDTAIRVSEKNAEYHNVNANIFKLNILTDNIQKKYDIILSNPPYIESDIIPTLQTDVREFEPLIALDGGKDGLCFYPKIINKSVNALNKNGYLIMETGETQAKAVADMMSQHFCEIKLYKDLAGKNRVVSGILK